MKNIAILGLCMMLLACKNDKVNTASAKANSEESAQQFNNWLAEQFKLDLSRDPQFQTSMGLKTNYGAWTDISSEYELESKELAEARLAYLKDSIDAETLTGQDKLSYDLYYNQQKQELKILIIACILIP